MRKPYPFEGADNDYWKMPKGIDHLVYHNKRYEVDESPKHVYIPTQEVMFKMMRACIGVSQVDNLWFNECDR